MPNAVPVAFANATSPQPTSNLDSNFNYLAAVVVDTLTALRLTTPKTSGPVRIWLAGYAAVGTGGSGWYWFNAADTTTADNGFSVVVAADGGRWYLEAVASIGGATIGGLTVDATGHVAIAAPTATGASFTVNAAAGQPGLLVTSALSPTRLDIWNTNANVNTRNWAIAASQNAFGDLVFRQSTALGGDLRRPSLSPTLAAAYTLGLE